MTNFREELEDIINKYSQENGSNTPDYILADYLNRCLETFNATINSRERFYGRDRTDYSLDPDRTGPRFEPPM